MRVQSASTLRGDGAGAAATILTSGEGWDMGHPLDLLERARREGAPLIDGERATFVWEGERPPRLAGDFNRWGADADVGGDGMPRWRAEAEVEAKHTLWSLALTLP